LYSESCTRFLVEVAVEHEAAFATALGGTAMARLGHVTEAAELVLCDGERVVARLPLSNLEQAFHGGDPA
jgi:hypothetical protein